MNKKLISIILSLVLVLSATPIWTLANETPISGFEFSELGNEYALLKELKIADAVSPADKTVTRGEFSMLASKTLNIFNPSGTSASSRFSDVSSSNPYIGSISALLDMKIMNGNPCDTFRPDSPITLEEAACVAVRMINAHLALGIGNSMADYVSAAAVHGILDGITTSDYSRTAHRAEVYIILYNVLKAPLYVNVSYTDEPTYTKSKDVTLLSENWKIKKAIGLVYADNFTSIYGERTSKENTLNIQGKIFASSTETTVSVVGREIEFYYFDDAKEPVICFAYIPNSKTIELSSEIIIDFDYLNGIYTAEIDGKEKEFKIGDSYYLSYNGDSIDGSDPNLMNPSSGMVTLVDNGNNVYDVVMVTEYQNIVVDYYDSYANTIVDLLDSSYSVCIDDYTNTEGIEDYGKLERYNIVTALKSPSGNNLKLYPAKTAVTGIVTEYSTHDGIKVTVNDRVLNIRGDVRFGSISIEPGNSYTFYLDYYGNVAYMTQGGRQGGIILSFSSNSGLNDRQCLVLTKTGERKIFTLASHISVKTPNGTQRVGAGSLSSVVPEHSTVLFETNGQEQINEIVMPMIVNTEDEYKNLPDYPLFRVDYFLKNWPISVSAAYQYREEINGFANWLILDSATVMQIPVSPGSPYTEENTLAYGISEFQNKYEVVVNPNPTSEKTDGEIEVYQTSSDFCAPSILVIHGGNSNTDVPLDTDNMPYMVTSITNAYDEVNEKSGIKLEILGLNGKSISAFLTDESLNDRAYLSTQTFGGTASLHPDKQKLSIGDIVQVSQRADDGRIGRIALLYDAENNKLTYSDLEGYNRIFRLYAGKAVLTHGTYFEYNNLNSGALERTNLKSATIVVCHKNARGQITTKIGSRADIMPDDKVVIYARYINNRLLFVYKQ